MNEYYYQYADGNQRRSGLVLAEDKHAAYKQIHDLLSEDTANVESQYWEFTRVDQLLSKF